MATGGENPTNIIGSEEAFDFECGLCKLDDKTLLAKGYCSDCDEYLCDVCFNTHCRPMPCRHHVLLDADEMPKQVVRKPTVNMSLETCTKHPGKTIEYFCPSHDFLGCSACITMDHRSCDGVLYILDEVDTFYDSEEYKAFKSRLASEKIKNRDIIYVVDDINAESEGLLNNTKQQIKSFRKNVDKFMDNLEKTLEEKAVFLYKQNSDILKELSAECNARAVCFQLMVCEVEELERRQQTYTTLIKMKRLKQDIVSYKIQFYKTKRRLNELTSFSFKPLKDRDIKKLITTFGAIVSVGEESTFRKLGCKLDDKEVTKQSGPPNLKNFVTQCNVGTFKTEAEGNSEKLSKKHAAEPMLKELKALPTLAVTSTTPAKPADNKKKNGNLIKKTQKADPTNGEGINPISRLIQIQQSQKKREPVYTLLEERELHGRREFVMQVQVEDHTCTVVGPNKKLVKRHAAEAMLQLLGFNKPSSQPSKPANKMHQGDIVDCFIDRMMLQHKLIL